MDGDYDRSMRKFLKRVGVTSQQAIGTALREKGAPGGTYTVKALVTIDDLDLAHEVTGTITGADSGILDR